MQCILLLLLFQTVEVVEVGCRGYNDKPNENRLKTFFRNISKKVRWPEVKNVISKLAILGSFSIFSTKEEHLWYKPSVLKPYVEMKALVNSFASMVRISGTCSVH